MTPTLARMVAQKINELPRPIRWFSIANFWRYEKPQRGRGREFFQLNTDVFGIEGVEADLEIISIMANIMKGFGATEEMFEIRINNRKLMDDFYKKLGLNMDQVKIVNKALDKRSKISKEEFEKRLSDDANLDDKQIETLTAFIENPSPAIDEMSQENSTGALEIKKLLELIKKTGLENVVRYDATTIRGLDYYTGTVFEVFDLNPQNPRALAGGGRYDDLISLFGNERLTGTGFAMGDITLQDFLQTWNLLPIFENECEYFVTLWPSEDEKFMEKTLEVAELLRSKGKTISTWLEKDTKIEKQLKYADKKGFKYVIIIGENEIQKDVVIIKNMVEKTQEEILISSL